MSLAVVAMQISFAVAVVPCPGHSAPGGGGGSEMELAGPSVTRIEGLSQQGKDTQDFTNKQRWDQFLCFRFCWRSNISSLRQTEIRFTDVFRSHSYSHIEGSSVIVTRRQTSNASD